MNCILTESALLGALTASQLEDIRRQAPAGEDPVTEAILTSCARVDAYCRGRAVPGPLMSSWARDICVFYLAKIRKPLYCNIFLDFRYPKLANL